MQRKNNMFAELITTYAITKAMGRKKVEPRFGINVVIDMTL